MSVDCSKLIGRALLAGILSSGAIACGSESAIEDSASRLHPLDELRLTPIGISVELTLDWNEEGSGSDWPFVTHHNSEVLHLGRWDGDPSQVFGKIADVHIDSRGWLLILDSYYNNLRIFNSEGELQQTVGRGGRGPGEFLRVLALESLAPSLFTVSDLDRSLVLFEDEADSLVYLADLPIGLAARDMCNIGDLLMTVGMKPDGNEIVHVFDEGGEWLDSFGEFYRADNPLIASEIGDAAIACHPEGEMVAVAPRNLLGEIRAYGSDGRPIWVTRIANLRPPFVRESVDRAVGVQIPDEGFQRFENIHIIEDSIVAIQIAVITPESSDAGDDYAGLGTLFLNVNTGDSIKFGMGHPRIRAVAEGLIAVDEPGAVPGIQIIPLRDAS